MVAQTTLAFIGDVMLGRGVNAEIASRTPESFWGTALPILRKTNAVIANLECAITRYIEPWSQTPKVFYFRADPQAVDVLRAGNTQCVSLANNHTLDYQEDGLLDTLHYLDSAGIHHAGAGRNLEDAAAPAIISAAGLKVGVVAFTNNEPAFAAGLEKPGTNYIDISADDLTLSQVDVAIKRAREAGAELVVLSLHWGPNMVLRPPDHFRSFAATALDMGVDLLFGHSAHLFQGVQLRDHKLALYDTGDFLDDYAVDPELRNDWSFIFLIDADARGLRNLRMIPVKLSYACVNLATGEDFKAMQDRMRTLCSELGTPVVDTPEGLEVAVSP